MAYYPSTSNEQWSGPPTYTESNENYASEYYNYSNGYADASEDPTRQFQKTISAKDDSTLITNEVALSRVTSGKKSAVSAPRGDAVKKKLELDKMEPNINPMSEDLLSKKPVTFSEKFQAWMINEGNELFAYLTSPILRYDHK